MDFPKRTALEQPPWWVKWEMLFWLWGAFFLNQADRALYGVVLPQLKKELALTPQQEGLIGSVFFWTLACVVPLAGYASDLVSRRKIISGCLFFWSLATSGTALARNWLHLMFFRSIATGGGEAFYAPAANALIGDFHQKTRSLALSIHQTSLYFGVIASGFLGGMAADRWGWRAAFWIFGAAGLVWALLIWLRLRDPPNQAAKTTLGQPTSWEALSILFRTPTALLLTLAFTADVFVNNGYMVWSPTFLHEKFSFSLQEAGGFSMLYHHVFAFVGVLAGGALSDLLAVRRPRARLEIQFLGLLLGAGFIYLMGRGETQTMIYLGMAGFGLFRGVYEANIYASLYEVIPQRLRASASGVMIMMAFLTGGASPLLLGMIKEQVGLAVGLTGLAVAFLTGAVALLAAWGVCFDQDRTKAQASSA